MANSKTTKRAAPRRAPASSAAAVVDLERALGQLENLRRHYEKAGPAVEARAADTVTA